jgi:hypothetical protein
MKLLTLALKNILTLEGLHNFDGRKYFLHHEWVYVLTFCNPSPKAKCNPAVNNWLENMYSGV